MTTLTAETPTLSPANRTTNTALLNAMAALHRLNELGCRVDCIAVSPRVGARLTLSKPPSPVALETLGSALKSRMPIGRGVFEVRVSQLLGCQIEWFGRRPGVVDAQEASEVEA